MSIFSPKQQRLIRAIRNNKLVIADGPIRSGKTSSAVVEFVLWASSFSGKRFAVGVIGASQFDVFLSEVETFLGDLLPITRRDTKSWWLPSASGGPPNILYRFIGKNKGSEKPVKAYTLQGVYVDEYAKLDPVFLKELYGRCTDKKGEPPTKFIMTCNPEGPLHPAKTEWIDPIREGDMKGEVVSFDIYDNPTLSEEYIRDISNLYTGVMYDRNILGKWSAATGLVYPTAPNSFIKEDEFDKRTVLRYDVAIDVGWSSSTHALLVATCRGGRRVVVDEWRHHGQTEGQIKSETQLSRILQYWSQYRIQSWIVDLNAKDLILILRQMGRLVTQAVNDIMPGVLSTNLWINDNRLKIIKDKCPHLVRELGGLMWDENAAAKGEDKPVGSEDHGTDALRYYCHTVGTMRPAIAKREVYR